MRRTLTEPPIEYRQPAETAAADELGEDEFKKQRRLKAEAKKAAVAAAGKTSSPGSDLTATSSRDQRFSRKKRFSISDALTSPKPE